MFQYIIIVGLAADGYTSSLVVKQKAVDVTPLSFTLYIAVRVVILYYWFAHLDIRVKMKTFDDSDHAAVFLRSLLDRSYLTVTLHRCVGDGVSCKRTYPIAQSLRRELGWRRDRSSPALNFFFLLSLRALIRSTFIPNPLSKMSSIGTVHTTDRQDYGKRVCSTLPHWLLATRELIRPVTA